MIEHNLDMIKRADYVVDMGPGGGINGGQLVVSGTPEQVAAYEASSTGAVFKGITLKQIWKPVGLVCVRFVQMRYAAGVGWR